MPVGIVLDFKGATLDQYDQVIEKMGLEPGGDAPRGGSFTGRRETDEVSGSPTSRETREQFEQFARHPDRAHRTRRSGSPLHPTSRSTR